MTINRKKFFDGIRQSPFSGRLTKDQVNGCEAILTEWERRKLTDLRHLAYMLATTKWETDDTMQPIREVGRGRGKKYGIPDPVTGETYYGRGYVQLTWKANYQKMQNLLLTSSTPHFDIVENPDEVMEPEIAAFILFEGMARGTFTGKKLSDYFNRSTTDWLNARRIINGTDRAQKIADIAKAFYTDLTLASN